MASMADLCLWKQDNFNAYFGMPRQMATVDFDQEKSQFTQVDD